MSVRCAGDVVWFTVYRLRFKGQGLIGLLFTVYRLLFDFCLLFGSYLEEGWKELGRNFGLLFTVYCLDGSPPPYILHLTSSKLEDDFVYDVEVAHQVEAGVGVVQALVGARGVEDVERTLAAHIEPFGQERHDASYLVPH